MNLWKRLSLATAVLTLCTVTPALADDKDNENNNHDFNHDYNNSDSDDRLFLYHANEFSFDVFGTGSVSRQTLNQFTWDRIHDNGRLGVGVGANYFLTKHFGIGADAYSENPEHSFIDSASGSLIARLPLGRTGIAPYGFGGGGYQFEADHSFVQAGVGIEFRIVKHFSIFTDARYVWGFDMPDYVVGRAGLRFSF